MGENLKLAAHFLPSSRLLRATLITTEVDILDPIMANMNETQPEKLHAWKRASRVERDPKRSKPDPGEGGPTPPVNPA